MHNEAIQMRIEATQMHNEATLVSEEKLDS